MKRTTVAALALVLPLSLAACSSPDEPGNGVQTITDRGELVIGTTGNNRPSIFKEGATYVGHEADWAAAIAKDLGVPVKWEIVDFKGIIPGVQAAKFDIALSGIRVTPERAEVVDFTHQIATEDVAAVHHSSLEGIGSPKDIAGKTVCVVTGSSNGEVPVKRIGTAKKVLQFPGVTEAFSGLKSERCDVMVTGRSLARDWQRSQGKDFVVSEGGVDCLPVAIALPKNQPELKARLNKIIDQQTKDGLYDSLATKWSGAPFPKCGS